MDNASLTRSLSKVKSRISSKFRSDSVWQEDYQVLKAMKYDDTAPASSCSGAANSAAGLATTSSSSITPSSSSSSNPAATSNATSATQASPTQKLPPGQESRSSSVVQMEPIQEDLGFCIPEMASSSSHRRATSQSTLGSSSILSELQPSLLMSPLSTEHTSLQSSRKTSLDDKENDQTEQLLPPPPMINAVSPQITTELPSPFGQLSPPLSPGHVKLRNTSISCDPLVSMDNIVSLMSVASPEEAAPATNPNDFADAMALSILDKVDGNADSNTEWKI